MILIVGNNRDDLLYFETVINNRKDEIVLDKFPIIQGTIANQAVILLKDVYTNVFSSLITTYLIEKYFVLFVIKVGRVQTLSKSFKNGDVIIEKRVKGADIDVTDLQGTKLGQIPGFMDSFDIRNEIFATITNSFTKRTPIIIKDAVAFSSNVHYSSPNQLKSLIADDRILGEELKDIVFDSEAFGIAASCSLYDIPYIGLGVVVNHIGQEFDTDDYVTALRQYVYIGKAVVNAIGEIGSNEVLRG